MFVPVVVCLAVAIVFYIAIPLAGAFAARARWAQFRSNFIHALELPRLRFADADARDNSASAGAFSLFGSVEAMEGASRLWIRGERMSAVVDMSRAEIFFLTGQRGVAADLADSLAAADEFVETSTWRHLPPVDSGARVFVAGPVRMHGGAALFGDDNADVPLVLFYDGPDEDLPARVIWAGRHRNEYWNNPTKTSLAIGLAIMTVILSAVVSAPTFSLTVALVVVVAFLPVMPLLPPGLPLFLAYRRFWREARVLRARRDVARLQARNDADVAATNHLAADAAARIIMAGTCFALGSAINAIAAFGALRFLLK